MDFPGLIVLLVIYLPVQYLAIIVHELGHYTVARALNITPVGLDIGTGPIWFKFQRKGTWFHFRKTPLIGMLSITPGHLKQMGLWGAIAMLLAGPICHLLFASILWVVSYALLPEAFGISSGTWVMSCIVAFEALMQLVPIRRYKKINGSRKEICSDGFQISNFWKRRAQFKVVNENW